MQMAKGSDRIWIATIVFYLCLIYPPWIISNLVAKTDFIKGDCYYYRAVIVSLFEDGDLLLVNNIETDPLNGQLALGKQGLVPKHPIFMPLVSAPFYKAFGDRGLLIFNIIDCMILAMLIFKLNQLFFDNYISFITTVLYATGTLFFNYVYNYSPDVFATVLVLAGLNLVLRERFYSGAVFLGLSVFAKLPNALLAGIILLYAGLMVLREHGKAGELRLGLSKCWGKIIWTAALFGLALAPLGLVNHALFGSPFVTGYQRTAESGPTAGEMLVTNHVNKFNQPFLLGAWRLLFDPNSGLVPTNPILILALLGLLHVNRSANKQALYLIITICAAQFLSFAKYDDWQTSEFSNRFLMTFVAGSSVLTSTYLQTLSGRFFPIVSEGPGDHSS
jgi:hypothetical protein